MDSTIIIDHVLGLQYKPDWRRDFSTPSLKLEDRHNFLFSGRSADGSWSAKTGYIATTWSFNRIRRLYQDQFLSVRKQCAGSIDEAVAKLEPLKRLAGDTVIAYVLRSRRWGTDMHIPSQRVVGLEANYTPQYVWMSEA